MRGNLLVAAVIALACAFYAAPAWAQLVGTDVGPGDSCAGYPSGATTMAADADLDGKDVILTCDGSNWVAARGSAREIPAIPLEVIPQKTARRDKEIDHEDRQALRRELEDEFADAAAGRTKSRKIDLGREFNQAAAEREDEGDRGSSEGPHHSREQQSQAYAPKRETKIRRYGRKKDRGKDMDRGR